MPVKAAEVKNLLEQIVGRSDIGTEISRKPFSDWGISEGYVYRPFDIIYSAGNLAVYIEAELGRKKRDSFISDNALVTPEQQREYKELVENKEREILEKAKRKYGAEKIEKKEIFPMDVIFAEDKVPHTTGCIVDDASDSELATARVESIVIQYNTDLSDFMACPPQKSYIEGVASFHGIKIDRPCYGTRGTINTIGVTTLDSLKRALKPHKRGYWKANDGNVFVLATPQEELEKGLGLEKAIRSVYYAGKEVERAKFLMAATVLSKA